jgi:hypothetical protein
MSTTRHVPRRLRPRPRRPDGRARPTARRPAGLGCARRTLVHRYGVANRPARAAQRASRRAALRGDGSLCGVFVPLQVEPLAGGHAGRGLAAVTGPAPGGAGVAGNGAERHAQRAIGRGPRAQPAPVEGRSRTGERCGRVIDRTLTHGTWRRKSGTDDRLGQGLRLAVHGQGMHGTLGGAQNGAMSLAVQAQQVVPVGTSDR